MARHDRPDEDQPSHAFGVGAEIPIREHVAHRVRHERDLLEAESLAKLIEILDQCVVGDLRGRHGRGSQRAPLVVEHESVLIGERLDRGHEVAVLCSPAAVQHDDRVAGLRFDAVLRDVVRQLGAVGVGRVHVPLVARHTVDDRERRRAARWCDGRTWTGRGGRASGQGRHEHEANAHRCDERERLEHPNLPHETVKTIGCL